MRPNSSSTAPLFRGEWLPPRQLNPSWRPSRRGPVGQHWGGEHLRNARSSRPHPTLGQLNDPVRRTFFSSPTARTARRAHTSLHSTRLADTRGCRPRTPGDGRPPVRHLVVGKSFQPQARVQPRLESPTQSSNVIRCVPIDRPQPRSSVADESVFQATDHEASGLPHRAFNRTRVGHPVGRPVKGRSRPRHR